MNPFSISVTLHLLNDQRLSTIHIVGINAVHQIFPLLCLLTTCQDGIA